MNLMVILVPFLLITAVFSRITILELNLPAAGIGQADNTQALQLEIIVRTSSIEVGDRNGGLIRRIPASDSGHDYTATLGAAAAGEGRFPGESSMPLLLLEPDIPYDTVVHVMDSIRAARGAYRPGRCNLPNCSRKSLLVMHPPTTTGSPAARVSEP